MTFINGNIKTYSNGQKIKNRNNKLKTDSILVFGTTDTIPDSATFIANTEVKSAMFFKIKEPDAFSLGRYLSYAKFEARRLRANVIKIERQAPLHNKLYVQLYSFQEPLFSACNKKIDSLKAMNEQRDDNYCVVHIKSTLGISKMPIYFNDSLVSVIPKMTFGINPWVVMFFCPATAIFEVPELKKWKARKNKILNDGNIIYHPLNLQFNNGGTLKISTDPTTHFNTKFIKKGREYYFYIFFSQGRQTFGPYLRPVTEEEYRLNELEY